MNPGFKFANGFALDGSFDVRVDRVHVLAAGVSHQHLANFLQNPGFHQARVEGVAQVMEPEVAEACPSQRRLPAGLEPMNRPAIEGEDDSFRLPICFQELAEPPRERNFPSFPARRLGTGY